MSMLFRTRNPSVSVLGSIHVSDRTPLVLSADAEQTYHAVQRVVFEHDFSTVDEPVCARYRDGSTLRDRIPPSLFDAVGCLWERCSLPSGGLESCKTWYAAVSIAMAAVVKAGLGHPGVDENLYRRALADGKEVIGIESPEEGLSCFESDPDEAQRYLVQIVASSEREVETVTRMLDGYRSQDIAVFQEVLREHLARYPRIFSCLTTGRNQLWAQRYRDQFNDGVPTLFVVGMLHCVCEPPLHQLLA